MHRTPILVCVQRTARLSGGSGSEGALLPARRGSSGVDARPWEIAFEELDIVQSIGTGSFGKARWAALARLACVILGLLPFPWPWAEHTSGR